MKKQKLLKNAITAIMVVFGVSLFAQDVVVLDPKDMIPADTGYYIGGVYKDKNDDGINEFYNGCIDEYGDASHNEIGTQFGFYYHKAMIMPTCWPKDAVDDHLLAEIEHAEGYIELTKTKYIGTDSAVLGYMITPAITNLDSIVIEASPDVSANDSRHIYFDLEFSTDGGITWSGDDDIYIRDETKSKKGDYHRYNADHPDFGLPFGDFINASKEGPIVIRILNVDQTLTTTSGSQRLKIHYIKIYAQHESSVKPVNIDVPALQISNNTISSESGKITVYNTTGQLIGVGNSVSVSSGIYIVRFENGQTSKVCVK